MNNDLYNDFHIPIVFVDFLEQLHKIYYSGYLNKKEKELFENFVVEYGKIIERLFL